VDIDDADTDFHPSYERYALIETSLFDILYGGLLDHSVVVPPAFSLSGQTMPAFERQFANQTHKFRSLTICF